MNVVSVELVEKAKSYFYGTATWVANLQERQVGMAAALEAVLPDIERPWVTAYTDMLERAETLTVKLDQLRNAYDVAEANLVERGREIEQLKLELDETEAVIVRLSDEREHLQVAVARLMRHQAALAEALELGEDDELSAELVDSRGEAKRALGR